MGWREDERDWLERTSVVRWNKGHLPSRITRWAYRHPVIGALAAVSPLVALNVATVVATGHWRFRSTGLTLVLPFVAWWHLRVQGELYDAWSSKVDVDAIREEQTAAVAGGGFWERMDARNQRVLEAHNEIAGGELDDMISPLARRYYKFHMWSWLVALVTGVIISAGAGAFFGD